MDAGIGRILEALDQSGAATNTLVWFMSDNGAGPGSNRPLRGGKGTLYEGGIRVPAVVRWPGKIQSGGKINAILTYLDVWPTLQAAAGMETIQGPGRPLDGVNVLDVLLGKAKAAERKPFYSYYERYAAESLAVIDGDWKLVRQGPPILGTNPADVPPQGTPGTRREPLRLELFELSSDPLEKADVSREHPAIFERLLAQLEKFRRLRPNGGVPPMTAPPPPGWKAPKQWEMKHE
jgi:arylsulfatase A-like enzyme